MADVFNYALDPTNRDYAIRTLFGEAFTDPASRAGVAYVMKNRADKSGKSVKDVVLAPNQFEPWGSRKNELLGLDPNSPEYQELGKVVDAVWGGQVPDPTGGATHFYAPATQAKLGRAAPNWASGPGLDIGQHRFYGGEFAVPREAKTITAALGAPDTLIPAEKPDQIAQSIVVGLGDKNGAPKHKLGGRIAPPTFSTEEDLIEVAKAMYQSGIPLEHIAASTGYTVKDGQWTRSA